ncbi:hypothetical protein SELMODRAFT_113278 [Selaginella moellendorffii]|uniref:Uncharacterized protein n=1 Tax=Selaginella moellendorffii TaxID=88036 RepID=D8SC43_SELML|nr:V-type proton ATPase subunit e2 [Selaginella moellendorffii]XP_002989319.1 V-type proton ATPase subunit e2 [Selaginella moellendorffii]EFJ09593.1 hypothetical protein SELMODRAFT_184504 [Selaginella moellendorffii]EFJ18124.1 hypothetical protein SELMODRAFT_113278 [Selaginella moellendorffii]|eukprot:XP_002980939.1 V-type proton ATPase subunit e2 [Selaginella moellendorffii]
MNFAETSLVFLVAALLGSVSVRVLFNKGPSANLLHITLVIVAAICCWLLWAIVYMAQMHPLVRPILNSEGE